MHLDFSAAWTDAQFTAFTVPALFADLDPGVEAEFTATPKFTGGLGATYSFELPHGMGTFARHGDYYHSSSLYYASILQRAYETANARIDWRGVGGTNFDVGLFVRNLADAKYIASGNLSSPGTTILTGSYNPPRMVGAQVRFHFGH